MRAGCRMRCACRRPSTHLLTGMLLSATSPTDSVTEQQFGLRVSCSGLGLTITGRGVAISARALRSLSSQTYTGTAVALGRDVACSSTHHHTSNRIALGSCLASSDPGADRSCVPCTILTGSLMLPCLYRKDNQQDTRGWWPRSSPLPSLCSPRLSPLPVLPKSRPALLGWLTR